MARCKFCQRFLIAPTIVRRVARISNPNLYKGLERFSDSMICSRCMRKIKKGKKLVQKPRRDIKRKD